MKEIEKLDYCPLRVNNDTVDKINEIRIAVNKLMKDKEVKALDNNDICSSCENGNNPDNLICSGCLVTSKLPTKYKQKENTKSKIEEAREYLDNNRVFIYVDCDDDFTIIRLYEEAYKELEEKYNKLLTNK